MANNPVYLEPFKLAVDYFHNWGAIDRATVAVHDVFRGETVWQGDVEAFILSGHPKAQKAYGWSEGQGDKERLFAGLEIPPVKTALDGVRTSIVADAKAKNGPFELR